MSDTGKKDKKEDEEKEKPPPPEPKQPEGPGDTGGSGKRRAEHLNGSQDGPFRHWSCYCPSAATVSGD